MIILPNGHKFDFCCAAGALGYDGRGYSWEWPLRWAGLLDPSAFTVITKTLTASPRRGNLRWYAPWRAVRLLGGGNVINAVGLTNPGLYWWLTHAYPVIVRRRQPVIVSIFPENTADAATMAIDLNKTDIVGIEVNAHCPNVVHDGRVERAVTIVKAVRNYSKHPVIVKPSHRDAVEVCHALRGVADAFDLGQSVPWAQREGVYSPMDSPLEKYGYSGALSGPAIKSVARRTLVEVREVTHTPLISGGGIDSLEEVEGRFASDAGAVAFGTLFLCRPWTPNRIIEEYRTKDKGVKYADGPVAGRAE